MDPSVRNAPGKTGGGAVCASAGRRQTARRTALGALLLCSAAPVALADDRPIFSPFGSVGLIDTPTAELPPDGQYALSSSYYDGVMRMELTFQIFPRVSGTFRYSYLRDFDLDGDRSRYDRSFDVQVQALDEGVGPAVAIGLRDFGGTGIYASEYVVATKHFLDNRLIMSGGIGWGRLGSYGSFSNPLGAITDKFDERPSPSGDITETGRVDFDTFFRGPAALFAGIEWRQSDKLAFRAEYSSDAYDDEVENMGFDDRSPFNFSATYRFDNNIDLTAFLLHGSTLGLATTVYIDPGKATYLSGREGGPPLVVPADAAAAASWGARPELRRADGSYDQVKLADAVSKGLSLQGIELDSLRIEGPVATVRYVNRTFDAEAQGLGRAARTLTGLLPPEVRTFRMVPLSRTGNMAASAITLQRQDLEELEFAPDQSWRAFARAQFDDAAHDLYNPLGAPSGRYPNLDWRLGGYLRPAFFDPNGPLRADLGTQLTFGYDMAPGLMVGGAIRQKLIGNLDDAEYPPLSSLPHVRSEGRFYDAETNGEVTYLTLNRFDRPGENFFSRMSAGYLEQMYGGVSGEVLWYPVASSLALGGELNWVKRRDYDGLGFLDYDVWTGHVSAYYDFGGGYQGQLDVGRYLAGDWGATFSLDREFNNGFRIGAFFTLTDVPFEEFGEGSFDKGIRFTIPFSWLAGEPGHRYMNQTIRTISRDGGARVSVPYRLYGLVRKSQETELQDSWGRFWR